MRWNIGIFVGAEWCAFSSTTNCRYWNENFNFSASDEKIFEKMPEFSFFCLCQKYQAIRSKYCSKSYNRLFIGSIEYQYRHEKKEKQVTWYLANELKTCEKNWRSEKRERVQLEMNSIDKEVNLRLTPLTEEWEMLLDLALDFTVNDCEKDLSLCQPDEF